MKFSLILMLLLSTHAWAKWSVTTYNIRNFDKDFVAGSTDISELQKVLKSVQSDVMAFEEVVNKNAFKTLMKSTFPSYSHVISSCGGGGKQYLALAFDPAVFDFVSSAEDMKFSGSSDSACGSLRPMFIVTLSHRPTKKLMSFAVTHLKAGGAATAFTKRWEQYKLIEKVVSRYEKSDLILLGDFNTTGYNIKNEDYTRFEETLNKASLRTMSETLGCTSYWEGDQGGIEHQPSILDHIVLQDRNVAGVQEVKVGAHCARSACRPMSPENLGNSYQAVSDHCPVQVTFK